MKTYLLTLSSLMLLIPHLLAADPNEPAYATPEEAAADPDFAIQGEYADENIGIQVIALGEGQFRAVTHTGGLPGAGWDKSERTMKEGDADAIKTAIGSAERVERKSSTLGAKPPEGAVVLFDGKPETLKAHWQDGAKMTDDGLLMQGCTSTDTFGSAQLHIEFRLPYMPKSRGQGRGNSGYYIQGRYECQMLDSFGLDGLDNECGGIYSISRPDVNMCLPPLAWQTYDVDYTLPTFKDGQKTKNGHILIKHNDVVIHDRELTHGTPGGPLSDEGPEPGPVYFQDHGNPVRYRNIWVVAK